MDKTACFLCKNAGEYAPFVGDNRVYAVRCEICMEYFVHAGDYEKLLKLTFDSKAARVNLVSETIRSAKEGLPSFWIMDADSTAVPATVAIKKRVRDFESLVINHADKPDEILKLLAWSASTKGPFSENKLSERELYEIRIDGLDELQDWIVPLIEEQFLENQAIKAANRNRQLVKPELKNATFKITPKGWARLSKLQAAFGSRKAFLALSFDAATRPAIQAAIEAACHQTGWEPFPVDADAYIGGVVDEIIAKVKGSHFVIAEFTNHSHGVYWEAGYAEGKGMKVIYAVREDQMKTAHFDTRHKNHITWKTPEELTKKLVTAITAVVG